MKNETAETIARIIVVGLGVLMLATSGVIAYYGESWSQGNNWFGFWLFLATVALIFTGIYFVTSALADLVE